MTDHDRRDVLAVGERLFGISGRYASYDIDEHQGVCAWTVDGRT